MLAPNAIELLEAAGLPVTGSGYYHLTFKAQDGGEICISIHEGKLWVTRHEPWAKYIPASTGRVSGD